MKLPKSIYDRYLKKPEASTHPVKPPMHTAEELHEMKLRILKAHGIEIETGIPVPPKPVNPYRSMICLAVKSCPNGDSFRVDTLAEAQKASIQARRMKRRAMYRKQPDGTRRVWVFDV